MSNSHLEITGPTHCGGFDLYEAKNGNAFSCIAICTKNWDPDTPALGGTRHIQVDAAEGETVARDTALELAGAMYSKNSILMKAARALGCPRTREFGWQGGKGVILTPVGLPLTPYRLIAHGRLVERLHGTYFASKDAGVGTTELRWINSATQYTIGLGCKRDTGEATANGVLSGLQTTVRRLARRFDSDSLSGMGVLVIGAGKVGYPLVGLLQALGARTYVYDPKLDPELSKVLRWADVHSDPNATVSESEYRKDALLTVFREGRILSSELEALTLSDVRVVSPNGGPTRWLASPASDGRLRSEILAQNRACNRRLELILGAGNDQVPITTKSACEREAVLSTLAAAGIVFVPDPLVSTGGVIAVSHELMPTWDTGVVNADARTIVEKSIEQAFDLVDGSELDSLALYRAFEDLIENDWTPRKSLESVRYGIAC